MNLFLQYLKIFLIQVKNNWVRVVVYRTNFLLELVVDAVWIIVEFSMFAIIYANTSEIAGWTQPQVYFFLGIFFVSDSIFSMLFQTNFWHFSDLVNKGELDTLLTKPVHPLFLALTRWISITSIFNTILGTLIAIRFSKEAGFAGGLLWFNAIAWVGIGVLAQLLVRFAFCICIFWTERSFALSRLYFQFFQFASKPDTMYPKVMRNIMRTILPFAVVGSVPARALLHGISTTEMLAIAVSLFAFFIFDAVLWKVGLKRYQSASS